MLRYIKSLVCRTRWLIIPELSSVVGDGLVIVFLILYNLRFATGSRIAFHASRFFILDSFHEQSSGSPPEWISCSFADRCQSAGSSSRTRARCLLRSKSRFLERKRARRRKSPSSMGILLYGNRLISRLLLPCRLYNYGKNDCLSSFFCDRNISISIIHLSLPRSNIRGIFYH